MTGATAKRLWESAVEPARSEAAILRQAQDLRKAPDAAKAAAAKFRLTILAEALGALRLALIAQVTRCEDGVLGEITSEWSGLQRLAADTGKKGKEARR